VTKRQNRPSLNILVGKENLVGIEIGVHIGNNALWMLENLDIKKLYLIDPYDVYPSNNPERVIIGPFPKNKKIAKKLLSTYSDKIEWIYKYSWDALDDIPDKVADFVYIDGDHRGSAVYKDLQYYKKVKPDSLLCGHDWRFPSIKEAVEKFTEEMRVTFKCCDSAQHVKLISKEAQGNDWWIRMPPKSFTRNVKCELCQKTVEINNRSVDWLK
jgi:predicted O-methyltransferase YrrM